MMTDTWRMRMSQRAMSIDNISFLSPPTSNSFNNSNNINNNNASYDSKNEDYDDLIENTNDSLENLNINTDTQRSVGKEEHIIPWRAHLRKTNSRLSLIG